MLHALSCDVSLCAGLLPRVAFERTVRLAGSSYPRIQDEALGLLARVCSASAEAQLQAAEFGALSLLARLLESDREGKQQLLWNRGWTCSLRYYFGFQSGFYIFRTGGEIRAVAQLKTAVVAVHVRWCLFQRNALMAAFQWWRNMTRTAVHVTFGESSDAAVHGSPPSPYPDHAP